MVSEELQKIPFDEGYSSDLSRASKVIPCLALGANTDLGSLDGGNDPENHPRVQLCDNPDYGKGYGADSYTFVKG